MTTNALAKPAGDVVARVDFQYRWRTWALFLLFFVWGLLSLKDGFIVYPRDNAAWARMDERVNRPAKPPHEASSVIFNQIIGIGLTVLSIPLLAWRSYRSRGAYRLVGDSVHVPGHPPVTLSQIRGLDLVRWDRKGIAVVEWEDPAGQNRRFNLNDMIYERTATDRIVDRIETHLNAQDASAAGPALTESPKENGPKT
jgi:hypothetical protein